jgi:hypothetical protein
MLIVGELLLFALCVMLWMPDTAIGKALHHALIEAPVKALDRATLLKVIVGIIVFFALIAFILGAPETVALMGMGDLSFYLDLTVISLLVSAAVRLKSTLAHTVRLARVLSKRVVTRTNRARARKRLLHPRMPKSPQADDEDGAVWDLAFA